MDYASTRCQKSIVCNLIRNLKPMNIIMKKCFIFPLILVLTSACIYFPPLSDYKRLGFLDQTFEYQNYWPPPNVRLEDTKEEAVMLIGGKHCMKASCEVTYMRNKNGTGQKITKVVPPNDRTIKFFTQYGFCRMKPSIKLPRMFNHIS